MWVTTDDLSLGLLARKEIAVSRMVLTISAKGRITGCMVPTPSQHLELDRHACALTMKRGRYKPARDGAGNRVESTDSRTVRWQVRKDWQPGFGQDKCRRSSPTPPAPQAAILCPSPAMAA
ncbi:hypothetical protein CV103_16035 [Sphingomonas fennica]|uniref:TonB C-terminal domain-containing protein n=1 Tax=Edaphosphingomonas fennica TaxID=114404 RepID=A0A2T4HQL1_9SPHN|nr:hypothetical protein CV103_16035 [Sphingomonas fennica]